MAVSWLLLVAAGAVFVSMVVLVVGCLHCWNNGALVSITQSNAEDEASHFRIIHQRESDPSSTHPTNNQIPMSTYSPSVKPPGRRPSFTPSQGSVASYVNPPGANRNADSDAEDADGYIEVLPDVEPPPKNPSRASSRSSDGPAYVNIEKLQLGATTKGTSSTQQSEDEEGSIASYVNGPEDDRDYLNVDPSKCRNPFLPGTPESSDSEEDYQNYVNVDNGSPQSRTDCELFSGHPF